MEKGQLAVGCGDLGVDEEVEDPEVDDELPEESEPLLLEEPEPDFFFSEPEESVPDEPVDELEEEPSEGVVRLSVR